MSDPRAVDTNALFNSNSKSIIFFGSERATKATIRHEFYHAHNFFYHQNGKCKGTHGESVEALREQTAPIYPRTQTEIERYHQAFARGDKRINEYISLIEKEEKGQLTENEKKRYEVYSKALSGCLPIVFQDDINEILNQNHFLEKCNQSLLYYYLVKFYFYFTLSDADGIKMMDLRNDNGKFTMIRKTTNLKSFANSFKDLLIDYHQAYQDKPPLDRIAEREAYTFETLSEEAQKVIYREAYALRKQYLARCAETPLEKNETPQRMEL
jgi:hypothetical protein